MVVAIDQLLRDNPNPTEAEVRRGLDGNLCRCTGYQNIVKSVLWAAAKLRPPAPASEEPPAPVGEEPPALVSEEPQASANGDGSQQ